MGGGEGRRDAMIEPAGVKNVLSAAVDAKVKRVVMTSAGLVICGKI